MLNPAQFPAMSITTGGHTKDNLRQALEAPQGAVTVASPVADPDPGQPKGYYLRNVGGQLWLRGYICDDEYIWQPADQFAFLSRK